MITPEIKTPARRPMAQLLLFIVLASSGCASGPFYVEPTDVPDDQLAVLSGPMAEIDGFQIQSESIRSDGGLRVLPGDHSLLFWSGGFSDIRLGPGPSTGAARLKLRLKAGHRYKVQWQSAFTGERLRIDNLTTHRAVYFDLRQLVYYHEDGSVFPHAHNEFFEP